MPAPKPLLKGWEKVVANTVPDPKKRITLSDPDTRGLFVRITPKGNKTYTVVARDPLGKQVWAAVGEADILTLTEAREMAREGVKRIKAGLPAFPKAPPPEPPAPPAPVETFRTVAENFIKRHVQKQALRSEREIERIFTKYVYPEWGHRALYDIRRGDVANLLDKVEDGSGPVMADRVLATISKMFNWQTTRDDSFTSPIVRGMGRSNGRERARKRILTDDEIRALWKGATGSFGAFAKICLLTGQRRAKVAQMMWADIADDGTWTIAAEAREKVNAGELQLPKMAIDIINAQPRVKNNPYVFAGRGNKAMAAFSAGKRELDKAVLIAPWMIHDLRRTAKSLMARAGVRPDISERVLGHVIPGVEGIYDRHSYAEEKAAALGKLAGLVELILNPPAGNVVELREAVNG